jgi:hypothetical protein
MFSNYSFYKITDGKQTEIFFTKNKLTKFIYNAKRNKNDNIIKTLLHNDYTVELLDEILCDRIIAKKHLLQYKKCLLRDAKCIDEFTKIKSLQIGIPNEKNVLKLLNNTLKSISKGSAGLPNYNVCKIEPSKYEKTFFDFYITDLNILIELKTLNYDVYKYKTAVMNTCKLKYSRMIFLFDYKNSDEGNSLYYHIYNPNRVYKTRLIKPFNRIALQKIIDIPIEELNMLDTKDSFIEMLNNFKEADENEVYEFKQFLKIDKLEKLYRS